ncbi:MAG: replication-associated recombination protein A [Phycisphaerales bacterium]|nr:MAG: replication-associated recombination protein A [Phycisphaerales bacterium]
MSDLWQDRRAAQRRRAEPLAVRVRPRTLDEVVGQRHLLAPGKLLRRMLEADAITSLILHGPPGTGKTTLAELIAGYTKRHFERENAASVGVKRIREIADQAAARLEDSGPRTILFLDEIHRFTRAQQDVLLGDVERGTLTLIGATTENPLFACNSALVSRSTLFRLEPLTEEEIGEVVRRAASDPERGFGKLSIELQDEAVRVWAMKSDGDARRALTALEVAVLSSGSEAGTGEGRTIVIDHAVAEDSIQQKAAVYDQTGDEHYDGASAMIKSVRGSDPDAAVYWIARMLEGGEDPRFIARRLAILASEDIGNADPRAIGLALDAWNVVERVGMPEARITLAQAAIYLSLAPKSNASYVAIKAAEKDVREGRTVMVPVHIRDPNSSPIAQAGEDASVRVRDRRGERYAYSHDAGKVEGQRFEGGVTGQDYLGVDARYYEPTEHGMEKILAERLKEIRAIRRKLRGEA